MLAAGFMPIPDTCLRRSGHALNLASGKLNVMIRNGITGGDVLLTGFVEVYMMLPAGTATLDRNGVPILTSTGMANGATRGIVAAVQRGVLNLYAALRLPGVQADTNTDTVPEPEPPESEPVPQILHRRPGLDVGRHHHADGGGCGEAAIAIAIGTRSITEPGSTIPMGRNGAGAGYFARQEPERVRVGHWKQYDQRG